MLDIALIKACTDPSLSPAIARQFVDAVGADDPLTVTVRSGERLILVPKPRSPSEALALIHQYLGRASVRVGVTQYPAGVGIATTGEKQPGIIEPCDNLKMGTALFAKVMRIVGRSVTGSQERPNPEQVFDAATQAWRTGLFEGEPVFSAVDRAPQIDEEWRPDGSASGDGSGVPEPTSSALGSVQDVDKAGIRIDLTRINGQK